MIKSSHGRGSANASADAERMRAIKSRVREEAEARRRALEEEEATVRAHVLAKAEEEVRAKQATQEEELARKRQLPWRKAKLSRPDAMPAPLDPVPVEVIEDTVLMDTDAEAKDPDLEKSLEAIYLEKEGRIPELGKLERRRSWRLVWMFGAASLFVALLVGVAWAGYFLFQPFRDFRGQGMEIALNAPTLAALGREETLELVFTNRHVQSIERAEIRLAMPRGFTPVAFDPMPTKPDTLTWQLNQFAPGQGGVIRVRGFFFGALGEEQPIQVMSTYRPLGYGKDVEGLQTSVVRLGQTVFMGQLLAPPKAVAGDPVTLRYEVANRGDQPMRSVVARITVPRAFVPAQATSSGGVVELAMGSLPPNATGTVQLLGSFAAGTSGDMDFHAEAGWKREDGRFLVAQQADARVGVFAGDLLLRLVANGADTDKTIQPGEPLRMALAYQNVSPEPLKDVSLTVGFETIMNGLSATGTSLLDWGRLDDARGGASSTKTRIQTITYTKRELPQLESLPPQSEGLIEIGLPTRGVASGTRDAMIRILVTGQVPVVGETRVQRTVRLPALSLRYKSDAVLASEAWYYTEEGAPVGYGPLPPVVGKTTSYRIVWRIEKRLHPLQNVKVSAVLPKIVRWSGKTMGTGGTLLFDETTRVMSWTMPEIADGMQEAEVAFDVQVTPEEPDAGRFASLLGETKLEATDAAVNEPVVRLRPPLSTDLQNDDGAKGKGVVRAK